MAIHIVPRSLPRDVDYHSPVPEPDWQTGADPASREWSIVECARALYRRRLPLLCIAGSGILLALLASALQTPRYQSRASIQIQALNENFLNLRDIFPTAAPLADSAVSIQTQAEILRQDALLEQVVARLHLDERPDFVGRHGLWNRLSSRNGWTALDEVRESTQIVPARGSSIIQIVCDARDPKLAADLANTLAQIFIDQNIDTRRRSAFQTQASLSLEREIIRQRLVNAEGRSGGGTTSSGAMKRDLDADRQFYDVISRRVEEARVASTVNQSNVRLVSPARPAAQPFKPNLLLNLALGSIAGLVLGIGYVMLREQTNSLLRTPGDAAACLSIPELGTIPKASNRKLPAVSVVGTNVHPMPVERASLEQPSSELAESFRALLTSVLSSSDEGYPHILTVTSSGGDEGKTTVVSNLAIALAEIGHKVLLIDADLRHPRLHKIFDQPNSWGLSDLLREKNAIEELPLEALVKRTNVPRLHLLPSGTSGGNIFGLLWSGRLARILPGFRQLFDYILIDTPPCVEFADARIIGRYTDALLLVVRADYTERQTAQAAAQRLRLDGIPVMGVIFNGWNPAENGVHGYDRQQEFA